jgi:hypothetical protein
MPFITKGKTNWKFILIVVVLAAIAGAAFWLCREKETGNVACTQEAKICPDGSAVGRTGPNCEFAACPDATSGWKTYRNEEYGFEFKYPENFGANVWRPFFWPATTTVVIEEDPVEKGCPNFPGGSQGSTQEAVRINNIDYTLHKASDGAAGSSYLSYCYVTEKDLKYCVIDFVIRVTNGCGQSCSVYCGTQYQEECLNFNLENDVEKPIENILSTFKFLN